METYLLSLLTAACMSALIGILTPDGTGGGIARHMRLLISLVLLCLLIAPIRDALSFFKDFASGDLTPPHTDVTDKSDYQTQMEDALNSSSKLYFIQLLTEMLENGFSIENGDVRCAVRWSESTETLSPTRITVILSGRAIWKDPAPIEDFVTSLLGCECVTAIE